jgi:hypothetical protein
MDVSSESDLRSLAVAALAAGGVRWSSRWHPEARTWPPRESDRHYHRVSVAEDASCAEFRDANGIACIDNLPAGAVRPLSTAPVGADADPHAGSPDLRAGRQWRHEPGRR